MHRSLPFVLSLYMEVFDKNNRTKRIMFDVTSCFSQLRYLYILF